MMSAATLLMYAQVMLAQYEGDEYLPDDWRRVEDVNFPLYGFTATIFRRNTGHWEEDTTVLAIRGVEPRLIDLIGAGFRRLFGYNEHLYEKVRAELETRAAGAGPMVILGHSGGGGYAHMLGSRMSVPVVTFNSGRPNAAQQMSNTAGATHVFVIGDRFGDPINHPRLGTSLPGVLYPVSADFWWVKPHRMEAVVEGLLREVGG